MPAIRYATVIRALRLSLAAGLLLFLAVIGLYLFGRQGDPAVEQVASSETTGDEYAVRGEGFEFALTKGDQVVFEIRGREQRSDLAGTVYLEDVGIAMQRGDGPYRVEGDRARYDQGTQGATLEGDVVIRGPGGMLIETARLELGEEGSRVHALEGVRFASGDDLRGRADALEADLDSRVFSLSGSVEVESPREATVPFWIETSELVFREESASVVARGGVVLESGESRLRGQRLHLFLDPATRELELLRVLSEVEGELAVAEGPAAGEEGPAGGPLRLRATSLELRVDPATGEPLALELRGLERRPARIVQVQPDGSVATLTLVALDGTFRGGALDHAELEGPLWLTQGGMRSRRGAERQLRARSGEARFAPGGAGLAGLTLIGEVSLRDGEASATGDRAYLDLGADSFEIFGDPAHVEHPRGVLDAPHAIYRRDAGILSADGGVQAVLREGGDALLPGLAPDGGAGEPLRVEAGEAIWEAEPASVRFLGAVRAWQGADTLFAEQLRAEPDAGRMSASGGVRTRWEGAAVATGSDDEPGGGAAAAAPAAVAPGAAAEEQERPAGPLEVTASELAYSESEELLVYTGSVLAVQDWTSLACERMTIELGDGETDEIHCEQAVRIVDSRNARTLEGDRAIYYPEVPEVEVFGDPLLMTDAAGNRVEGGRHFVYDLESGSSRLTAKAAESR